MCKPPNYCSYCLTRLKKSALRKGDAVKASQIDSIIHERQSLRSNSREEPVVRIDLSELQGKIQVDLDDTVGSFEGDMRLALARLDGLTYEEALVRYPANPKNGISDWWDEEGASWREYLRCEEAGLLYKDQPVREGAREVINWLHKTTRGGVEFLTARPEDFNEVSARWLKERVGIDFTPIISNSNAKHEFEDFEVMIDDSVPHVNAITSPEAPYGPRRTVFMTRPRSDSQVANNEHVYRAWSWRDIKEIFSMESTSGKGRGGQ